MSKLPSKKSETNQPDENNEDTPRELEYLSKVDNPFALDAIKTFTSVLKHGRRHATIKTVSKYFSIVVILGYITFVITYYRDGDLATLSSL